MGSTSWVSIAPSPRRLKSVSNMLPSVLALAGEGAAALNTALFLNSPPVMMLSSNLLSP